MKKITLVLLACAVIVPFQAQHFGNYVFEDKTAQSRSDAIDAIIDAAQRIEANNYRTYEDLYVVQHPESCTFDSYTEETPYGTITYYLVNVPELGVTIECKYASFVRKRIYWVPLVKNGNGKIINYGIAQ